MSTSPKNQKETKRNSLLQHASLPKNTRAIVLSFIQDKEILGFLKPACEVLNISLIAAPPSLESIYIEGADAFIADQMMEEMLVQLLLRNQVVPILPAEMSVRKIFTEFNPMKFEGNAFLFEQKTRFHIFEKLICYLENIRYTGDKKTLLQNVEKSSNKNH